MCAYGKRCLSLSVTWLILIPHSNFLFSPDSAIQTGSQIPPESKSSSNICSPKLLRGDYKVKPMDQPNTYIIGQKSEHSKLSNWLYKQLKLFQEIEDESTCHIDL